MQRHSPSSGAPTPPPQPMIELNLGERPQHRMSMSSTPAGFQDNQMQPPPAAAVAPGIYGSASPAPLLHPAMVPLQQQQSQQLMQQQLQQPHQAQQHQQLQSQFLQPVQQQQHMYGRQDAPGGAAGAAGVMRGAAGALRGLQQGPLGAKPYCKYFMKRITTNVSHVLFYVVDAQGLGKLAVVGTDVKLSGHFVYASMSEMAAETMPLRCTNRGRVLEWLAALGASEPADDHEVVLPELLPQQWQQLHSADPMWTKPRLDREYSGYREETGTLQDGRHFKNYYLVNEQGDEKLMVMAEDGARLDRRYTYKASEDVGGFCFENGKAVTDWLEYVLGKAEQPPSFMRREGPPERKRRAKKEPGGQRSPRAARSPNISAGGVGPALLSPDGFLLDPGSGGPLPPPGGLQWPPSVLGAPPPLPLPPPPAPHHHHLRATLLPDDITMLGGPGYGSSPFHVGRPLGAAGLGGLAGPGGLAAPGGLAGGLPWQESAAPGVGGIGLPALRMDPRGPPPAGLSRGHLSPLHQHHQAELHRQMQLQQALKQQQLQLQQQQRQQPQQSQDLSGIGIGPPPAGPGEFGGSAILLNSPGSAVMGQPGGKVSDVPTPLSKEGMSAAVLAAGAEVRAVFSGDPDLLDWVTQTPPEQLVEDVRACAEQLMFVAQGKYDGPAAAQLAATQALGILHKLCQTSISLRLLELTRICRPVAMLSHHQDPQLRDVAARLTQQWRRAATAAHDCASAALRGPPPQAGLPAAFAMPGGMAVDNMQ